MSRAADWIIRSVVMTLTSVGLPELASAHKGSDSFLWLEASPSGYVGRLDVAVKDLHRVVDLDETDDGDITWSELRRAYAAISDYAVRHIDIGQIDVGQIDTGQIDMGHRGPCPVRVNDQALARHTDGIYLVLRFDAACTVTAKPAPARLGSRAVGLHLDYNVLFDADTTHRAFVHVRQPGQDGQVSSAMLTPTQRHLAMPSHRNPPAGSGYFREGIRHVLFGYDHLLFLVCLLLPTVLVRRHRCWEPAPSIAHITGQIVRLVTVFSLAHATSLTVTILAGITLPERLVEPLIALTVLGCALNNVYPWLSTYRTPVIFALGLVHGCGFAGALNTLGLPNVGLAVALAGLNIGVELGQLIAVVVLLPVAFALRTRALYSRVILPGLSLAVSGLALIWFIERSFDIQLTT